MARIPPSVERLLDCVRRTPGGQAGARRAILEGQPPSHLEPLLAKIERHPHRVLDSDVEALRQRGMSEVEIYEIVVAASLESGARRMRAGLDAIGGD